MNCPYCKSELEGSEHAVCSVCGGNLLERQPPVGEELSPPSAKGWLLFFAALLAPPLLTLLTVWSGQNRNGLAVGIALVGGAAGGIISGVILGARLGKTTGARIAIGVISAGVLSVLCIGMSCFGCMAGGYKLDLR